MNEQKHGDLRNLDWEEVLQTVEGFATSGLAKEQIRKIKACDSANAATAVCAEVMDASLIVQSGIRPFMESLDLFSTWYTRLAKSAVMKVLELKDIRFFCLEALALQELLREQNTDFGRKINEQIFAVSEPLSAIDQIITPHGEIRSDASEKLYRLHNEKEKLAREVHNQMERLVRDHQMESILQEKFVTTREGRWVLPVRSGMQHVMPGVIHGSSQTKQTVYMEPDKLIPLNNRLRQIDVEIEEEIERLLTELSHYLTRLVPDFAMTKSALQEMDVRLAEAQLTVQIQAQPIQFVEGNASHLALRDLRHPLLQLSGKKVIPNTVELTPEKSILLLTGPNAGGKTVLLKSIGLAAQMARCGFPVCAELGSQLPFFREIMVSIGDAQSVGEELSTFAAHLKKLSQAAQLKGGGNLILIDEICGSTDAEEGAALGRAFIEEFAANHSTAVITSHLSPLKSGWSATSRVVNGSLESESSSGRPLYKFIAGVPGESLAILTAKRVGVSIKIVEKAIEHLSPQARHRMNSLSEVEQMKAEVLELQERLRKDLHEAQAQKLQLQKRLDTFEKEKEQWVEKTVKRAEKEVKEAIQQAKVEDVFTRHRTLQDIKTQLPEIVVARTENREPQKAVQSAEDFGKKFPPGTKVNIPSLAQDAIIESLPNARGEVLVMSNSLRLSLPWTELRPPNKPSNPTSQLVRASSSPWSVSPGDMDRTLDLRGKMVEEALENLEVALDRAAETSEDRLKVIHGHGTEALKRAVRTYLSRSVYVKKWKAGTPESGGDGVTWVELLKD